MGSHRSGSSGRRARPRSAHVTEVQVARARVVRAARVPAAAAAAAVPAARRSVGRHRRRSHRTGAREERGDDSGASSRRAGSGPDTAAVASRTHRATRRATARIASRAKPLARCPRVPSCVFQLVRSSAAPAAPRLSTRRRAWRPPQLSRPRASPRSRPSARAVASLLCAGVSSRSSGRLLARGGVVLPVRPIHPATCSRARRRSRCGLPG